MEEGEARGGEDTEEVEGMEGTGALTSGTVEESSEGGETTGETLFFFSVSVETESGT